MPAWTSTNYGNEKARNQTGSRFLRWLRDACSEYRLLFTLVFILNFAGAVQFVFNWYRRGYSNNRTSAFATSLNLTISIVIRVEHVVNFLFTICTALPSSTPLWLRRRVGKIYHLGGLHSGCGVAATFWFILLSVESTVKFCSTASRGAEQWILIIVIYILDCLLISIVVMAHPSIREKLHNAFEIVHRLAGWSCLALLWILTVLNTNINRPLTQKLSSALFGSGNIWLLFISTFSIIVTWANCRKITVQSERLSEHALRLKFDYSTPEPGTTIRISSSPLFEWHAFATWSKPDDAGFSLIISNAGDWTNSLIENPPQKIWARRTPTCGVLRIAPMFKSVLLVATGSGIAPCLPVIMANRTRINLFWSTRDPLTTYGPGIGAIVTALGKNAYIHNTSTMGRPSTLQLVMKQFQETNSEAVIVISNPKLTFKLVKDLEHSGIPAFGPIWDS